MAENRDIAMVLWSGNGLYLFCSQLRDLVERCKRMELKNSCLVHVWHTVIFQIEMWDYYMCRTHNLFDFREPSGLPFPLPQLERTPWALIHQPRCSQTHSQHQDWVHRSCIAWPWWNVNTLFHLSITGKKRCLPRLRLDSRTLLWFVQHHYQFHYLPIGWSTFIDWSASDILSRTSRLLLVSVPQLNGLSDGLTIGHLRLSDLCLHLKTRASGDRWWSPNATRPCLQLRSGWTPLRIRALGRCSKEERKSFGSGELDIIDIYESMMYIWDYIC